MPFMADTDVVTDFSVLNALDFSPVCEYTGLTDWLGTGDCENPADFIVWISQACHEGPHMIRNFCNDCLKFRQQLTEVVCGYCGAVDNPREDVIRVEPIKG